MADFIIPTRDDLEEVLDAIGVKRTTEYYDAGLVMLAAGPAGGATWKIVAITRLPEDEVRKWEAAMQREAVWPTVESWADNDAEFYFDLMCVVGDLRRIIYSDGEVKYIDARQPQADRG